MWLTHSNENHLIYMFVYTKVVQLKVTRGYIFRTLNSCRPRPHHRKPIKNPSNSHSFPTPGKTINRLIRLNNVTENRKINNQRQKKNFFFSKEKGNDYFISSFESVTELITNSVRVK